MPLRSAGGNHAQMNVFVKGVARLDFFPAEHVDEFFFEFGDKVGFARSVSLNYFKAVLNAQNKPAKAHILNFKTARFVFYVPLAFENFVKFGYAFYCGFINRNKFFHRRAVARFICGAGF